MTKQGKEINVLLPSTLNSPTTALILSLIVRYQIGHPGATKDDCSAWILGEGAGEVEKIMSFDLGAAGKGKGRGKMGEGAKGKKRKESA